MLFRSQELPGVGPIRNQKLDHICESIAEERASLNAASTEIKGLTGSALQIMQERNVTVYKHAGIDLYLDPALHGLGLGTDAVRTLARHLFANHGHHRLVIDPAADNVAAIRCYSKVGFRPVGVMRRYERGLDGSWHDGLLMDLLADELISNQ